MRCRDFENKLEAYLDGTLEPTGRNAFEEHIKTCERCHSAVERRQSLLTLLNNTSVPPLPEGFANRVMATAKQHVSSSETSMIVRFRPAPRHTLLWSPMRLPAAAALILGLLLGVFAARDTMQQPSERHMAITSASIETDVVTGERLDYLAEAPEGSLTDVYLNLISK